MGFAAKHNKGSSDWGIDSNDFPFMKRNEVYKKDPEKVHKLLGIYINSKGNYDPHPVAISEGYKVDLPDYMTEDVREILKDEEDIANIKSGKVGFKLEEYTDKKYKKLCYGVKWVDIE